MRLIDVDAIVLEYGGLAYIPHSDGYAIANYFADQIKRMPTVDPEPKWVPYKSGDSVDCERAYCYCQSRKFHGKWCEVLFWDGFNWYKAYGRPFNDEDNNVLAWYPLPSKPYKEETL